MSTTVRHVLTLLAFLVTIVVLSGCGNTIDGVGQDISRIGRGIQ